MDEIGVRDFGRNVRTKLDCDHGAIGFRFIELHDGAKGPQRVECHLLRLALLAANGVAARQQKNE
jgi:hypothetical protein